MTKTIQCAACKRRTTIEKRETDERMSRRRWFIIRSHWGVYGIVCGGNDQGVVKKSPGLEKDLFPDGKGGLIQHKLPPHEIETEIDLCMAEWASKWEVDMGKADAYLFMPDSGEAPRELAMVPFGGEPL
jgi:hypothetical protein